MPSRNLTSLAFASLIAGLALASAGCPSKESADPRPSALLDTLQPISGPDLDDPYTMSILGQMGSAVAAAYVGAYPAVLTLGITDPDCPSKVDGPGGEVRLIGGCTDSQGNTFAGSAAFISGTNGSADYDHFAILQVDTCAGVVMIRHFEFNGTITGIPLDPLAGAVVTGPVNSTVPFESDLEWQLESWEPDTCLSSALTLVWRYAGEARPIVPGDATQGTEWNGQGTIGVSRLGKVEASTVTERRNYTACSRESVSGNTTFTAAGNQAVITYDGLTDCDPASTVTWTFDGSPRGELEGIECSVTGFDASGAPIVLAGFAGVALLVIARRRRTRS